MQGQGLMLLLDAGHKECKNSVCVVPQTTFFSAILFVLCWRRLVIALTHLDFGKFKVNIVLM